MLLRIRNGHLQTRQGSNVTGGDSANLVCSCLLLRFSKFGSKAIKMAVPRFGIKLGVSIK